MQRRTGAGGCSQQKTHPARMPQQDQNTATVCGQGVAGQGRSWVKDKRAQANRGSKDSDMSIRKCSKRHRLGRSGPAHVLKRREIAIEEPRLGMPGRSNSKCCHILTMEYKQIACIKPGPACSQRTLVAFRRVMQCCSQSCPVPSPLVPSPLQTGSPFTPSPLRAPLQNAPPCRRHA